MNSVCNELWEYSIDESEAYKSFHIDCGVNLLKNFLFSTMDEVRARHAEEYSGLVLKLTDMGDASYFRANLLRREFTGLFSYSKQRDHAAHTLYNYLLGWYFYSKSKQIKGTLNEHFRIRENDLPDINSFGYTWPFLSLLHDIGYLLEGSLDPLSTETQSKQTQVGVNILNAYFQSEFWAENNLDSVFNRHAIKKLVGKAFFMPQIAQSSLIETADSLRFLGDLETVRKAILGKILSTHDYQTDLTFLNEAYGLPGDSFDLWRKHYQTYNNPNMVTRITATKSAFNRLQRAGLNESGIRHLDHGVCSGLIALLYSTYFFVTYFSLPDEEPTDLAEKAAWLDYKHPYIKSKTLDVDPVWWWTNVVWATAGAAIHNIQQLCHTNDIEKLSLNDDPLAYLGIIVDIIQDWDRYGVSGTSSITGHLPTQGKDVLLGMSDEKIVIKYNDKTKSLKIKTDLNNALNRWDQLILIK